MSKSQRDKGSRRERELVNLHLKLGVHAERVPLSGGAHYRGAAHDIDVHAFGRDRGALVCEVKARASGEGFVTLEKWVGENDLLFLVRDRQRPLVVLPWRVWELILNFLTAKRRSAAAERAAARRDPRQLDLFDNERMPNGKET